MLTVAVDVTLLFLPYLLPPSSFEKKRVGGGLSRRVHAYGALQPTCACSPKGAAVTFSDNEWISGAGWAWQSLWQVWQL